MSDEQAPGKQPEGQSSPDESGREAQHRWRMRHQFRDLIEDLIEDGRQRGLFDNLEGAGEPLSLDKNAFEGSAALANKLLKDNDLRPAWLSHRVTVQERIDDLRSEMRRTWGRYRVAYIEAPDQRHRDSLVIGWDDACLQWLDRIAEINKLIDSYNLRRPASALELYKLKLEYELERIEAPRYLASFALS